MKGPKHSAIATNDKAKKRRCIQRVHELYRTWSNTDPQNIKDADEDADIG